MTKEKFEEFKKKYLEKFLEIHNFENYLKEAWQEYQNDRTKL